MATPSESRQFADLYPMRRRDAKVDFSAWDFMSGRANDAAWTKICEENVSRVFREIPTARQLLGAIHAQGCDVTLERHFACQTCPTTNDRKLAAGGYDEKLNQVFVCANVSGDRVGEILIKGLIEMFDRCARKVDFANVNHLACIEVRKANLASCRIANYYGRSGAHFALGNSHRHCVKLAAKESLTKTKFVDADVADEAVERVFERCYADLEPVGRRLGDFNDCKLAHEERYLFGYN